jgi:hypothetical protein
MMPTTEPQSVTQIPPICAIDCEDPFALGRELLGVSASPYAH